MKHFKIRQVLFLLLGVFITSCAVNPVTGKKELMLVSESQELAMGANADPGIIASMGLYQDEKLQAFINEKGKNMGAISHRPDLDYKFRILDSPVINAFAVPGGYIYFTRGIMAHFNNEAEFAGVLGHEIGHITARHSAAQMSKQQVLGIGAMAGAIAFKGIRNNFDQIQQGLGLMFLKFGRDDESQSDMLGVDYSTQVGYDAHEMANFFGVLKRMQVQSGQEIPTFLSTHPDPGDRFNKVHQMATEYQSKKTSSTPLKVGRNEYLKMIDGIIYGDDPRQGYVENNVFFHPGLKFLFPVPQSWKLINSPQMVQMGDEQGKAIIMFTLAQQKTLDEAAQAAIEQYSLSVVESGKRRVNGNNALAMISVIKQQQQQQGTPQQQQQSIRALSYFIQYGGQIYTFMGLSKENDFNTHFRTLQQPMEGFQMLSDPSKINVAPDKIRVVSIPQSGTLQAILQRSGIYVKEEQEKTALLNNMQLQDNIQAGTYIKVIKKGKR
ncbi:MAG: M48 family metalloprotease [Saprospiraceae bacterium]